jgi:hypothetical protein
MIKAESEKNKEPSPGLMFGKTIVNVLVIRGRPVPITTILKFKAFSETARI